MNVHFVNPWLLHFLWLVPAAGFVWLILRLRGEARMKTFFFVGTRQSPTSHARFYWQYGMLLAALTLLIVAAARPQWGTVEESVVQSGRDLVIALDVSRSMLAQDVRPNRLERAKADIMDLLKELRGDRAALVVFRGSAVQLCPLSIDYSFLEHALDGVTVDSAPPGPTNIGDGIIKALEAFGDEEGAHRAVILISDGEDLSESIDRAAQRARKLNIPIFTVGLGSTEGAVIPDPHAGGRPLMHRGEEVITRLVPEAMRQIAEITGGAYIPVGTGHVRLGPLYRDHLTRLAARDIEEVLKTHRVERYQAFLLPALILILATSLLSSGMPALRRRRSALAACLVVGAVINVRAESEATVPRGRDGARIAYQLYERGEYREAAETYILSAKDVSPILRDRLLFNAACALYKAGEYEAAADQFEQLAGFNRADPASASYNLGCSLYRLAEEAGPEYTPEQLAGFQKAGAAFQNALRIAPDDSSAAVNLSVVTNLLPRVREQVMIRKLMEKYGDYQPFQIADEMLMNQREINEDLISATADNTPARINLLEKLGGRQVKNADLLIPLEAVSGPQISTKAQRQIETLRNGMLNAAGRMRDLEDNSHIPAGKAESGVYGIWKDMAPYGPLLEEDIRRQAGAIGMTQKALEHQEYEAGNRIKAEQDEATDLTQLFKQRFADVPPVEHTDDTDEERLTEDEREKILELAKQALDAQERAANLLAEDNLNASVADQKKSLELLEAIKELLPKDIEKQQEPEPDPEQDDQKQDPQPEQDQQPEQDPQPEEDPQQGPEPDRDEQQPEQEESVELEGMTEEQLRTLLERALQREKEHKREKMQRDFLSPVPKDIDW